MQIEVPPSAAGMHAGSSQGQLMAAARPPSQAVQAARGLQPSGLWDLAKGFQVFGWKRHHVDTVRNEQPNEELL